MCFHLYLFLQAARLIKNEIKLAKEDSPKATIVISIFAVSIAALQFELAVNKYIDKKFLKDHDVVLNTILLASAPLQGLGEENVQKGDTLLALTGRYRYLHKQS